MMSADDKIIKEIDFTNNSNGISHLTSYLSLDDNFVMESTGLYWLDLYNRRKET